MTTREKKYLQRRYVKELLAGRHKEKWVRSITRLWELRVGHTSLPSEGTAVERWPIHGIELTNAEGKTTTIKFDDKERT